MTGWSAYTGPHAPGYSEQVYLMELNGDDNGMNAALLKFLGKKAAQSDRRKEEAVA